MKTEILGNALIESVSNYRTETTTEFDLLHYHKDKDDRRDALLITVKTKIPKGKEELYIEHGYHICDEYACKSLSIKKITLLEGLEKVGIKL